MFSLDELLRAERPARPRDHESGAIDLTALLEELPAEPVPEAFLPPPLVAPVSEPSPVAPVSRDRTVAYVLASAVVTLLAALVVQVAALSQRTVALAPSPLRIPVITVPTVNNTIEPAALAPSSSAPKATPPAPPPPRLTLPAHPHVPAPPRATAPKTNPTPPPAPAPKPTSCGCADDDLMCHMRCSVNR